jgi:outer membrane protein assembly factor BamD
VGKQIKVPPFRFRNIQILLALQVMKRNVLIFFLSFAGIVLLGTSCSKEFRQNVKYVNKGTFAQKDSAAFFFYNRGDYEKASFLFEELLGVYRGNPRAQTMLYHYAYSKYKSSQYVIAGYYFEQFVKQYPKSDLTEECRYMVGYCYYMQSDPHYLDQQFTRKAINQFQLFINSHPLSPKVPEANELISKLRERLAEKAFEQAKLYYKISNFKASTRAFQVMIEEYPDSGFREEAQFMLFKSSAGLAEASVSKKQEDRLLDAIEYFEKFVDKYPQSAFTREAEDLYARVKKSLGKIQADKEEAASRT